MSCNLCPRKCNIDRSTGIGYCQSDNTIKIARSSLHMWEEPCISGAEGSGTIFFAGCNLRCVFCQNREISRGNVGKSYSVEELADIMLRLEQEGANNINLVTATHYVDKIIPALEKARTKGLRLPIVYNTSSYENVTTIQSLNGYVDIYLPDFKYYDNEIALKYSFAGDYRQIAIEAIDEMVRQCGQACFDDKNMMTRGVIVRHLILPGYTKDSKEVIKLLHDRYGNKIYISIMNQYTPLDIVKDYPELNRKITTYEYDKVVDYAISIGVENGFVQEGDTASESFIPDFDV